MSQDSIAENNTSISVSVDLGVYSEMTIKKACYRIGDQAVAELTLENEGRMLVEISAIGDQPADQLKSRFLQELLDHDLREKVAEETNPIRNLIMAHALSRVPLINAELDDSDYE